MPESATRKVILALSVRIDVLNSSKLKKFSFQLDKTTEEAATERWVIQFDLFDRERKTDPFAEAVIHARIDVSLANVAATEKTALAKGFTVKQTQYVVTVLAAAAKQLEAGAITQEQFDAAVEAAMAKR